MDTMTQGRPAEILLVEDNPGDVRLIKEGLRDGKVLNTLHVAANGEEAIAFLRHQPPYEDRPKPDLILLDLNLPRKDGRQVLAEIKNDEALKRIPVVVLTTSQAEEDILNAYDLNCNCYITKPVDLEQFIRAVEMIDNFWLSVVTLPPKG